MSKFQIKKGMYRYNRYGRLKPARWRSNLLRCFKKHNPQCGNCTFCRGLSKKIYGDRPEKLILPITLMRVCYIKDTFDYHIKRVFDNAV